MQERIVVSLCTLEIVFALYQVGLSKSNACSPTLASLELPDTQFK